MSRSARFVARIEACGGSYLLFRVPSFCLGVRFIRSPATPMAEIFGGGSGGKVGTRAPGSAI